jgi:DNA ligase D-like protein (predicted ligase)
MTSARKPKKILDDLPDEARDKLRRRTQPSWTSPMLATLVDDYFSDPDWIYERKFDGERCLTFRKGNSVHLKSRNRQSLNGTYPELVDALREQSATDFIIDGEVVAFRGNVTSFERLQNRMNIDDEQEARESRIAVYYYVFDLIHIAGHDVSKLPLRRRKGLLRRALSFSDPLRFTTHRNEEGEKFIKEACRKGWEGLIAKDAGSEYVHSRSRKWLKFKCVNQQEFVIGGFTDPQGERIGFGALLIGYYEDGNLRFAGKVGTGYDNEMLKSLGSRLESLERRTPPFDDRSLPSKGVHWVTPKLVGEVGFTEWTDERKLRHPRFLGLRRDKNPKSVKRERPA